MPPYGPPNPLGMMGVQGPLARTARDLELALDVLAGPDVGEDVGWKLQLPPPRRRALREFRVAVFPGVGFIPVSREVRGAVDRVVEVLQAAGATVGVAAPEGVDSEEHFDDYCALLQIMTSAGMTDEQRQAAGRPFIDDPSPRIRSVARGFLATIGDFRTIVAARSRSQRANRDFFRDWDILLAPITLIPAFEHDDRPNRERTIVVDEAHVDYFLQLYYPSVATFPGQPATAFPVTLSSEGLPIGLQAIGPYLEDRTPIEFAHLLEQELGGFVPPPRYAV
jgi:amidase